MEHWRKLLEPLVGKTFHFNDYSGTVIEIQTEPPALILRASDLVDSVQVDRLGRPQSITTPTWTQPLTHENSNSLHPDLQRQIPIEQARAIQAQLTQSFSSGGS